MNNHISKAIVGIGFFVSSISAYSALSPSSLNVRDLHTLVTFVEQHQKVADTLERIDFMNYTVVFAGGCKALFVRPKTSLWTLSKPGPQPDIEFDSSSCPLTYGTKVQE